MVSNVFLLFLRFRLSSMELHSPPFAAGFPLPAWWDSVGAARTTACALWAKRHSQISFCKGSRCTWKLLEIAGKWPETVRNPNSETHLWYLGGKMRGIVRTVQTILKPAKTNLEYLGSQPICTAAHRGATLSVIFGKRKSTQANALPLGLAFPSQNRLCPELPRGLSDFRWTLEMSCWY